MTRSTPTNKDFMNDAVGHSCMGVESSHSGEDGASGFATGLSSSTEPEVAALRASIPDAEQIAAIIRNHHATIYGEDGTWAGSVRHVGDDRAADEIVALFAGGRYVH